MLQLEKCTLWGHHATERGTIVPWQSYIYPFFKAKPIIKHALDPADCFHTFTENYVASDNTVSCTVLLQ